MSVNANQSTEIDSPLLDWIARNKVRTILIVAAIVVVLMVIYPPFMMRGLNGATFGLGYGFIFDAPRVSPDPSTLRVGGGGLISEWESNRRKIEQIQWEHGPRGVVNVGQLLAQIVATIVVAMLACAVVSMQPTPQTTTNSVSNKPNQ